MSAEALRRAAALMRERAEAATSGPWFSENDPDGFAVTRYDEYTRSVLALISYVPECEDEARQDAEHIASWHPAVAIAVADWLTVTAEWLEDEFLDDPEAPMDWDSSTGETAERVKAALAVARAYLGESQ